VYGTLSKYGSTNIDFDFSKWIKSDEKNYEKRYFIHSGRSRRAKTTRSWASGGISRPQLSDASETDGHRPNYHPRSAFLS